MWRKVKCEEYSDVLRFWQDLVADGMIHQCVNFLFCKAEIGGW